MAVDFLAVFIKEDLCWYDPDTEPFGLIRELPDVDENDGRLAPIVLLQLGHDWGHHLAGNAGIGPQVDQGNHAFDRDLFVGAGPGWSEPPAKIKIRSGA